MRLYNHSYSISTHSPHIMSHDDGTWFGGYVWTVYGAVGVYSQGSEAYSPHSEFYFAFKGRIYVRGIDKKYSQRGLITQAKKFAKEITEALG